MSEIIQSFNGAYKFLSLLYHSGFYYDTDIYLSAAAAFEAAKIVKRANRVSFWGWNCKPWNAGKMGKGIPASWIRPDWDTVQFEIMMEIQRSELSWEDLREKLIATGDALSIHGNNYHDNLWGICQSPSLPPETRKYGSGPRCLDNGQNRLDEILMQVRSECTAGLHAKPRMPAASFTAHMETYLTLIHTH